MAKSNAPVVTYNMPKCACNPGGTPNDFARATSMLFSMHRFAHEDHFHFVDNIDIPPFDNYPSYREAFGAWHPTNNNEANSNPSNDF